MLHRKVQVEALTGETGGPATEPRNQKFGIPMMLSEAEGNTELGAVRQSCSDPARWEIVCRSLTILLGDLSGARCISTERSRKAKSRDPAAYASEKSDTYVVPEKPSSNGPAPAEIVEERYIAAVKTRRPYAPRSQSRISSLSMGFEGVREAT